MLFTEKHIKNEIEDIILTLESTKNLNEADAENVFAHTASQLKNLMPFYKKMLTKVKMYTNIKNSGKDAESNKIIRIYTKKKEELANDFERLQKVVMDLTVIMDLDELTKFAKTVDNLEATVNNHHWAK